MIKLNIEMEFHEINEPATRDDVSIILVDAAGNTFIGRFFHDDDWTLFLYRMGFVPGTAIPLVAWAYEPDWPNDVLEIDKPREHKINWSGFLV